MGEHWTCYRLEISELSTAEQLKDCHKETTPESATNEEIPQPAVVRLITAVQLPARHGKLGCLGITEYTQIFNRMAEGCSRVRCFHPTVQLLV